MKPRRFFWSWDGWKALPDDKMTAAKAAQMFRAWRTHRDERGRPMFAVQRVGRHAYRITSRRSGISSVISWEAA